MLLLYRTVYTDTLIRLAALHSTMLLLYQETIHFPHLLCVNFTFHYASTISEVNANNGETDCLYIPLCFYYIMFPFVQEAWLYAFTFHYASTISLLPLCICPCKTPLHSTMLLLYQVTMEEKVTKLFLYIPLCFYYIAGTEREMQVALNFTFHYASTISRICDIPASGIYYFTFHYASTIWRG